MPANLVSPNVNNSLGSGGVILNSAANPAALRGRTFNADGTTRPFQFGTVVGGNVMIGGEGDSVIKGVSLIPAIKRYATFARLGYDFNENLHGYIEGGLADSKAVLIGNFLRSTTLTIRKDNPYLPTAVAALIPANGTISISRYSEDMGSNRYDVENKSPHGVVGLEGSIGDSGWEWDAHYSYGRNDYTSTVSNQTVGNNLNFSVDAYRDPATGNIVCAATAPSSGRFNANAAGCVPVNLFGFGNPSQAAIAYINQTGTNKVRYTQDAAAFNLKGEPFSTWAGPVSAAAGVEYRKENEDVTSSFFPANSLFLSGGNAKPWSGGFNVTEGYVETIVPLARDAAFAKTLDFNAAVRYADYSNVGGQTTWKAGLVWEPSDWLRFRATQSRDIRAPAPNELYAGGSTVTNQVTIPGHTPASAPQNTTAGNPNLGPEKADTSTAGFVIKPNSGFFAGLRMSVDYYVIDLEDAITNFSTQDVASQCGLNVKFFCDMFTFASSAANAAPTSLISPAVNIGTRKSSGIDVSIDYEKDFGGFKLATNLSATNTIESIFDTGLGSVIDRAGENGWANTGGLPSVRGNLSETLTVGKLSTTAQVIYISAGKLDVLYNTAANNTTNDNTIPAIGYLNLYGSYEVTPKAKLFAAVNNVLDRDPPHSPYTVLSSPVNGNYYDKVGRAFQVGLYRRF
jgi:outer membrane receptor protein involved in Fe transport